MATYSSILAQRIPGTEESDGLPSMGSHRASMMGELFVHFSRASGPVEEDGI